MEIDIMRLAKLAKLSIPEEKVEEFRKKMEDIMTQQIQWNCVKMKFSHHSQEMKCCRMHHTQLQAASSFQK